MRLFLDKRVIGCLFASGMSDTLVVSHRPVVRLFTPLYRSIFGLSPTYTHTYLESFKNFPVYLAPSSLYCRYERIDFASPLLGPTEQAHTNYQKWPQIRSNFSLRRQLHDLWKSLTIINVRSLKWRHLFSYHVWSHLPIYVTIICGLVDTKSLLLKLHIY